MRHFGAKINPKMGTPITSCPDVNGEEIRINFPWYRPSAIHR